MGSAASTTEIGSHAAAAAAKAVGGLPTEWPLTALVIGDAARPEFAASLEQISELTAAHVVARLDAEAVRTSVYADLVILLVSRPGEFSTAQIEKLRRTAPLARLICLCGSWCEGETRSGRPPAGVTRVYTHQWRAWFAREISILTGGSCGTLSLPPTVTDEERFLISAAVTSSLPQAAIAICSPKRETAAMLASACSAVGCEPVEWCGTRELPDGLSVCVAACVWDQATVDDGTFAALREAIVAAQGNPAMRGARWIVLADFPRLEDCQRAVACGACRVLSKPLVMADFFDALREICSEHAA